MKLLIAPDSFKGTYSARDVAAAIAEGARSGGAVADELPVADGGEGTLAALEAPLALTRVTAAAENPWGRPMTGEYGIQAHGDERVAVIEVAAVSGIVAPHDGVRDPVTASSRGTGMLMADAIRRGARHVIVAAGGSATTDGGRGLLEAIDSGSPASRVRVSVLTDVDVLYLDAPRIFGPQKGATSEDIEVLTQRLRDYARTLPRSPLGVRGSGAAGGLAGGLWSALDARIVSGAEFVLDRVRFDAHLATADAVIVGEGRLDGQTAEGKIISAVLRRAPNIPMHAVVGSVGDGVERIEGRFRSITIATDASAMTRAGLQIASTR